MNTRQLEAAWFGTKTAGHPFETEMAVLMSHSKKKPWREAGESTKGYWDGDAYHPNWDGVMQKELAHLKKIYRAPRVWNSEDGLDQTITLTPKGILIRLVFTAIFPDGGTWPGKGDFAQGYGETSGGEIWLNPNGELDHEDYDGERVKDNSTDYPSVKGKRMKDGFELIWLPKKPVKLTWKELASHGDLIGNYIDLFGLRGEVDQIKKALEVVHKDLAPKLKALSEPPTGGKAFFLYMKDLKALCKEIGAL